MQVRSPLTGSVNVELEKEIECNLIIENYSRQLNIDVSKYFRYLKVIQIYRCLDTGFRFYYPFNIDGNGEFYQKLQGFPWYYMDWKWEHKMASVLIRPEHKVLEIGCARGSFLERIQRRGAKCTGLELNESTSEYGRSEGLEILSQNIQDHAKENPGQYDVVCSFQVVEHISAIKEFLQASIDALKPSGKLIVSVPNNDSLIFKCNQIALNMPPHHMGLWDMNSLIKIQYFYNLQIEALHLEPLQAYHVGYAQSLVVKKLSQELRDRYGFLAPFMQRIGSRVIRFSMREVAEYINGHTVMAIYIKV